MGLSACNTILLLLPLLSSTKSIKTYKDKKKEMRKKIRLKKNIKHVQFRSNWLEEVILIRSSKISSEAIK